MKTIRNLGKKKLERNYLELSCWFERGIVLIINCASNVSLLIKLIIFLDCIDKVVNNDFFISH